MPTLDELIDRIDPISYEQTKKKMMIATKISAAMKEKGWNNIAFAKKLGRPPSIIRTWLSGTQNLTIDTLCEIEMALGITLIEVRPTYAVNAPRCTVPLAFMSYGR